jgi:hypothetical protein
LAQDVLDVQGLQGVGLEHVGVPGQLIHEPIHHPGLDPRELVGADGQLW